MSRTTRYRLIYMLALSAVVVAVARAFAAMDDSKGVIIVLGFVLLLSIGWPLRLRQAWPEYWDGMRLLSDGRARAAAVQFEKFLERLRQQPSLRRWMWLLPSAQSRSIEALTLNRLGDARLAHAEFHESQVAYEAALKIDPQYATPHYNLAVLAGLFGYMDEALEHLAEARRCGHVTASERRLKADIHDVRARCDEAGMWQLLRRECVECGYDLTGNVSGVCPECGCATKSLGKEECEVGP